MPAFLCNALLFVAFLQHVMLRFAIKKELVLFLVHGLAPPPKPLAAALAGLAGQGAARPRAAGVPSWLRGRWPWDGGST